MNPNSSFKTKQAKPGTALAGSNIDRLKKFFFKKKIMIIISLIVLLALAWHIRTSNVSGFKNPATGEYTLGKDYDPFLFLRYAKQIAGEGTLERQDNMRYAPLGFDTSREMRLLPYMIAYFHKILNFLSPVSIEYSAIIFPAFMFLPTVIFFFLFISKVFESHKHRHIIALISALFFVLSPVLITRTVAGFPDKESAGFLFMFLGLYLFLAAWKSKTFKKSLILAASSGIAAAFMQLIWGGWMFSFVAVLLFTFLAFISDRIKIREFLIYSIWLFWVTIIPFLSSERYNFDWFIVSMPSLASLALFGAILADFLIFKTKIKNKGFIELLSKKLPDKLISLLVVGVFSLLFVFMFFGVSFIPRFIQSAIIPTFSTDTISLSVSENQKPYFSDWKQSFGPAIKNFPVFFWLFFIGSIFFFCELVKKIKLKEKILLVSSYIIFLFGAIFSMYSPNSILNGNTLISKLVYFGSFLLLMAVSCYFWHKCYKEKRFEELKSINFSYLLFFIFFILCLFGAAGAIRLMMVLVPPASAFAGFFIVWLADKVMKKKKNEPLSFFLILLLLFSVIAGIYAVYFDYYASLSFAKFLNPSSYEYQWQKAMQWVRENTPKNAVFSHWWDYGYWIQTMGERATILDGGNAIGYWNYLFAKYVLTGETEQKALEFLYAHNAAYLLIDSTDIGKYAAFSNIASNGVFGESLWIGDFLLAEKKQDLAGNTAYIYSGESFLDEDYVFEENGKASFFPAQKTKIIALILTIDSKGELTQPKAVFVYKNKQMIIPVRHIYYEKKSYDFKTGYKGSVYIMQSISSQNNEFNIDKLGAALFLSERNLKSMFVQLYLFDNSTNFKLVLKQDNPVVEELKNSGNEINDFLYYKGVIGPIKIWKIDYPKDIKYKEEYLSTG